MTKDELAMQVPHVCTWRCTLAPTDHLPADNSKKIEELAKELHRFYRAAFKVLHQKTNVYNEEVNHFNNCKGGHDHGWDGCYSQKYFLKRAELILNGRKETAI